MFALAILLTLHGVSARMLSHRCCLTLLLSLYQCIVRDVLHDEVTTEKARFARF